MAGTNKKKTIDDEDKKRMIKYAPPSWHTFGLLVAFLVAAIKMCPSLESVDGAASVGRMTATAGILTDSTLVLGSGLGPHPVRRHRLLHHGLAVVLAPGPISEHVPTGIQANLMRMDLSRHTVFVLLHQQFLEHARVGVSDQRRERGSCRDRK